MPSFESLGSPMPSFEYRVCRKGRRPVRTQLTYSILPGLRSGGRAREYPHSLGGPGVRQHAWRRFFAHRGEVLGAPSQRLFTAPGNGSSRSAEHRCNLAGAMKSCAKAVNPRPSVTVVIVSYNVADWLGRCLDSIPAASAMSPTTVIVIDNASSDGSADLVESRYPFVELIRNSENVGFARAVNIAADGAETDYLLLVNPDGFLHPHAIDNLIDFAEVNTEYVICGGRTVTPAGDLDPRSCWAAPSLWSLFCSATMLSSLLPASRVFAPEAMATFARDRVRDVDIVTGCLLLIRLSDWRELGGFDDRYFVYGEDADLSLRVTESGGRCAITPDAVMVHAGGESSANTPNHLELLLAGRVTLLLARWPRWKAVLGRWLVISEVLVRGTVGRLVDRDAARAWREVWNRRRHWWKGYTR